jgi:hypothetical protein
MPATIDNILRWWGREEADRPALSLSGDTVAYDELNAWEPLPRLAMGKISKPALRQRYSAPGNLLPRVR